MTLKNFCKSTYSHGNFITFQSPLGASEGLKFLIIALCTHMLYTRKSSWGTLAQGLDCDICALKRA